MVHPGAASAGGRRRGLSHLETTLRWLPGRLPTAAYGTVLLLSAVAYFLLERAIIADQGGDSKLRGAVGADWKGKASPLVYLVAIALAVVNRWVSLALYVAVALVWLVPDRRLERSVATATATAPATATATAPEA